LACPTVLGVKPALITTKLATNVDFYRYSGVLYPAQLSPSNHVFLHIILVPVEKQTILLIIYQGK
jgi:hypothetical protein